MKKALLFFAIIFASAFGYTVQAIESRTAACTAGNLATVAASYLTTVTNLTVTGTIDARDFKTMRDAMPLLAVIDLSGTTVSAYTGDFGTNGNYSVSYPRNTIPAAAFWCFDFGKTSLKTFIYPSAVTSIDEYAFCKCVNLIGNLNIPSSVTSIGLLAYSECSGFTGDLNLPAGLKVIGTHAFSQCIGLTGSITIPSSVTEIGGSVFYGCSGLTGSITIPSTVAFIGPQAFNACPGINAVYSLSVTPIDVSAYSYVFLGLYFNCVLHVPVGSKMLYAQANQWKDFINIVDDIVPTALVEITTNTITLHPNPASSTITVSDLGTLTNDNALTLSITDISGNTLLTKSIEPSLNSATIDVSNLRSGAYVAVIQSINGNVVKRFLKR